MFRLGYNTNGLAHHRLVDALALVADLGYEALAITPDVGQLDLYRLDPREVERVRREAERLGLALAVETGARFLMDPARKHHPTLVDPDPAARARRIDFLARSVALADELGAGLVSVWSGAAPDGEAGDGDREGDQRSPAAEAIWARLVEGLGEVLELATARGVALSFEPEPGMFVERPRGYLELRRRLGARGDELGLTLDLGHLLCTGDLPVPRVVQEHSSYLRHVHLDDIAGGVHEHRMFGQGDLDLSGALSALLEAGYAGIAAVELSRDSHRGAAAAAEAMAHLRAALGLGG